MTRRSELLTAGIQYTLLIALNMIIYHEIGKSAYDNVWDNPSVQNLTAIINATMQNTSTSTPASNLTTSNFTAPSNISSSSNPFSSENSESFYLRYLPRNLFVIILLFPLSYYWHIILERLFPTRPRGVEVNYEKKEKAGVDHDLNEVQEEEVVKRWIAQGKVRRSSVSWLNTFVKWVLNITIGTLWFAALRHVLEGIMKWESFANIFGSLKTATVLTFFGSFFSMVPLASLISFVVVPARKRVVFEAGISTAEAVFLSAFIRLVIPWAMSTDAVQMFLTKFSDELANGFSSGDDAAAGMKGRLIDEL